ncbi:MAG: DUF58 domain-containing protein [Bacteroidales bacterium]|nr:DUF58 domain-containing protein [Bacteroidales bacterium]
MNTEDLLKKVHRIEIKAKRLSQNVFAGQYHSAFKGKGMTFSEVREYTYGDDIRNIDWNVTARNNHPYVKIFEEERELTVVLMIDVSGSTLFGSENNLKSEVITEIAAVLAFSAVNNNDKVGAILFSDKVEKYIPPKKGLSHILAVIRELLTFKRTNSKTDFSSAFMFLSNVIKKHSTCFLITDGFGKKFDDSLHIAARKHDLSCLFVNDKKEFNLSNMGLVQFTDSENGNSLWIDTSDRQTREDFKNYRIQQQNDNMNELTKYGIDNVQMLCGEDYIKQLVKLFAKRERR